MILAHKFGDYTRVFSPVKKEGKQIMKKITMNRNKELLIDEAFEMFLKRCVIKNLSQQTIKTYKNHYAIFKTYLGDNVLLEEIDSRGVGDFVIYLKESNNCNDISINSYLRTIRTFLYYMMEQQYLAKFKIDKLKVDKKLKEVYSEADLRLLLKKPDVKVCEFSEFRMWAFSNFLLGTGVRISSAIDIRNRDIDFDNAVIYVNKTKNRKAQVIPLSKTLPSILIEYMQYRGGEQEDYLFCSIEGNKAAVRSYQDRST